MYHPYSYVYHSCYSFFLALFSLTIIEELAFWQHCSSQSLSCEGTCTNSTSKLLTQLRWVFLWISVAYFFFFSEWIYGISFAQFYFSCLILVSVKASFLVEVVAEDAEIVERLSVVSSAAVPCKCTDGIITFHNFYEILALTLPNITLIGVMVWKEMFCRYIKYSCQHFLRVCTF